MFNFENLEDLTDSKRGQDHHIKVFSNNRISLSLEGLRLIGYEEGKKIVIQRAPSNQLFITVSSISGREVKNGSFMNKKLAEALGGAGAEWNIHSDSMVHPVSGENYFSLEKATVDSGGWEKVESSSEETSQIDPEQIEETQDEETQELEF